MELMLPIKLDRLPQPISYQDKILLIGSCFTEHIGNALQEAKFSVLQNPNGILFGSDSVCKSLLSYIGNKKYNEDDLFQLNEVWNSWQHHSRFSHIKKEICLNQINESQRKAHEFLKKSNWLIITLGSSFGYRLLHDKISSETPSSVREREIVANCHRAPANWFAKEMLEIDEIKSTLEDCLKELREFNPSLQIIFTVSPVRHIRDGVVENNRSKARLIESVHHFVNKYNHIYYFPAYELLIDVLRDYRFYDIDLVHPNYSATNFVLEKFIDTCVDTDAKILMEEVRKIVIARKHNAFQPETKAHQLFLKSHLEKTKALQEKYTFLDLSEELSYFSNK